MQLLAGARAGQAGQRWCTAEEGLHQEGSRGELARNRGRNEWRGGRKGRGAGEMPKRRETSGHRQAAPDVRDSWAITRAGPRCPPCFPSLQGLQKQGDTSGEGGVSGEQWPQRRAVAAAAGRRRPVQAISLTVLASDHAAVAGGIVATAQLLGALPDDLNKRGKAGAEEGAKFGPTAVVRRPPRPLRCLKPSACKSLLQRTWVKCHVAALRQSECGERRGRQAR